MERIDHVYVVEIGRGGFVGQVYGVFQRKAPHGKGLEFGISGFDAALVLIVKLAQAHRHLSASGTGGGDDDQRTGGLHIVVASEAFVGVYQGHIVGIALDGVVAVGADAHAVEALTECVGTCLTVVMGYNH